MTRFGYVIVTTLLAEIFVATAFINPLPRLIWNVTASVPVGLYAVWRTDTPKVGELVAVTPPDRLAGFLAERHYLPRGVPLLKHIAATAGQRVCRVGDIITVDHITLGEARRSDSRGRSLPVWRGCRTLHRGDVFLMNGDVPDSLDGRYFGPIPSATILGRLAPMLTRTTADGPLVWHGIQF